METVLAEDASVQVPDDPERCMTRIGMTGISQRLASEASVRCPEPAVMTVEVSCGRGHVCRERVCEPHGHAGDGNPHVCGRCLQENHVCPVAITRIS